MFRGSSKAVAMESTRAGEGMASMDETLGECIANLLSR